MNTKAFRQGYMDYIAKVAGFEKRAATRQDYTNFNDRLPTMDSLKDDVELNKTAIPKGTTYTSIGLSRNNPMNVHVSKFSDPWYGQVHDPNIADLGDAELGEAAFNTMENGLRAGARDIRNKLNRDTFTPNSFVSRYTALKPTDQSYINYTNSIANALGIKTTDNMAVTDENMPALMRAIIEFENQGPVPDEITDEMITGAIQAANENKDWSGRLAPKTPTKDDAPVYMPNSKNSFNRSVYQYLKDPSLASLPGYPEIYSGLQAMPTRLHSSIADFLTAQRENRGLRDDWTPYPTTYTDPDTGEEVPMQFIESNEGRWDAGNEYGIDQAPNAPEYEWVRMFGSPNGITPAGTNWLNRINTAMGNNDIDWDTVDRMVTDVDYPDDFFYTPEQKEEAFRQFLNDKSKVDSLPKPPAK